MAGEIESNGDDLAIAAALVARAVDDREALVALDDLRSDELAAAAGGSDCELVREEPQRGVLPERELRDLGAARARALAAHYSAWMPSKT